MTELYPDWVANQSVVVVRIPAAVSHINRGIRSLRTPEEGRGR
jgi:hypothetical protein